MTSINTNAPALTALTTLRAISSSLSKEQNVIATGLRVSAPWDNPAYWSISVGMRSTVKAISVVQDALGLSAAIADVTYSALEQTGEVLSRIRERILMAWTDGADRHAIQQEIAALAAQTLSIAESASFGGMNWLSTDVQDIYEGPLEERSTKLLSSYSSSPGGGSSVQHILFDLRSSSLFNSTGGGMLQPDPRSPNSIGGMRLPSVLYETGFGVANTRQGSAARQDFYFTGPLDFTSNGSITFDVTVDADNPSHDIDPPYEAGQTTSVTIDLALVNSVLPSAGGVISSYGQYISVLSAALSGSGLSAAYVNDYPSGYIPDRIALYSNGGTGLDGSHFSITNLVSDVGTGGLAEFGDRWGARGNSMDLNFAPFKVYQDVVISFDFRINGTVTHHTLDRETVDTVLGRDDGRVETAADMEALLRVIIGQPGLEITSSGSSVTINTDRDDRWAGTKSRLGFSAISVNIEPIPSLGIMDVDVESEPDMIPVFLASVDAMLSRVTDGAAKVGALRKRIDMQATYNSLRSDAIERGIGQLVDADMEKASMRLQALQVQQQLAIRALSIANGEPRAVLQLFRG